MIHRPLDASVAQLVEHHVANVNVEGSSPFARSTLLFGFLQIPATLAEFFSVFDPFPLMLYHAVWCGLKKYPDARQ